MAKELDYNLLSEFIIRIKMCEGCEGCEEGCAVCGVWYPYANPEIHPEYEEAFKEIEKERKMEKNDKLINQKCWIEGHEECACSLDGYCPLTEELYKECIERNTLDKEIDTIEEDEFPF